MQTEDTTFGGDGLKQSVGDIESVGRRVGLDEGTELSVTVGVSLGFPVGAFVGVSLGGSLDRIVGAIEGESVGTFEGEIEGVREGAVVGISVLGPSVCAHSIDGSQGTTIS